jgi:hypothetical protein
MQIEKSSKAQTVEAGRKVDDWLTVEQECRSIHVVAMQEVVTKVVNLSADPGRKLPGWDVLPGIVCVAAHSFTLHHFTLSSVAATVLKFDWPVPPRTSEDLICIDP